VGIVVGILFALFGVLAALAGLTGMRRSRRLRTTGVPVWAMAMPGTAAGVPGGPGDATVIQYELADGRVIERILPGAGLTRAKLAPGARVLVWYDPADPEDVLVFGRGSRRVDEAFLWAGGLLVLAGAAVAALAR
jgi:Protein of unknown function (DUF3592)